MHNIKTNLLKNIWKDTVGSKLISAGILFLLTLVYNSIVSLIGKTSFKTAFFDFWTFKVDVWILVLFLILVLLMYHIIQKPFKYDGETLNPIDGIAADLIQKPFKYDGETLSLDRKLFNQIRYENSTEDLILEIKTNGFSSRPFKSNRIDFLAKILEDSKKPDFEFFNPKLEKLKRLVVNDLENLEGVLTKYIYGTSNSYWLSIPSEWESTQPDRLLEAQQAIEKQENSFTKSYQSFISLGRKILKV